MKVTLSMGEAVNKIEVVGVILHSRRQVEQLIEHLQM